MAIFLSDQHANIVTGFGTFSYTATRTGLYSVEVQSTLSPPSSLVLSVNKNGGSSIVTNSAPTANQKFTQIAALSQSAVAGDVFNVVISSGAAADLLPNSVKTEIDILVQPTF